MQVQNLFKITFSTQWEAEWEAEILWHFPARLSASCAYPTFCWHFSWEYRQFHYGSRPPSHFSSSNMKHSWTKLKSSTTLLPELECDEFSLINGKNPSHLPKSARSSINFQNRSLFLVGDIFEIEEVVEFSFVFNQTLFNHFARWQRKR